MAYWLSSKLKHATYLDKGKYVGAILVDLSKTFGTINHELLLAKLKACRFAKKTLICIQSYLGNHLQRKNLNNNFSLWKDIFASVP